MSKISLTYPESGLTINISIKNRDGGVEAFSGVMEEVGTSSVYIYDFIEVSGTDYVYTASTVGYNPMSGVIYQDSTSSGGLTVEEHTKLMQLNGVGFINSTKYDFGATDRKNIDKIAEKLDNITKEFPKIDIKPIITIVSETNSHISLAKEEILNRMKEGEIEICSDIIRSKSEIKEDLVSTRQLVRQKIDKLDKNISKLADRQELTDKMIEDEADRIEESLEQIYIEEADNIEKEIEDQYKKEAQDIENEINL